MIDKISIHRQSTLKYRVKKFFNFQNPPDEY